MTNKVYTIMNVNIKFQNHGFELRKQLHKKLLRLDHNGIFGINSNSLNFRTTANHLRGRYELF